MSLGLKRKRKGLTPAYAADELVRQARALSARGESISAFNAYKQALAIREEHISGTEYPVLDELGKTYSKFSFYSEAIDCFSKATQVVTTKYYADHPFNARILDHWSEVFLNQRRFAEAEPLIRRSLEIKQKCLLQNDVDTVETTRTLAEVLRELGKYDEAEALLKKTLLLIENSTIGPIEEFYMDLAQIYLAQTRFADAHSQLQIALPLLAHRAGKNRRYVLGLELLADLLRKEDRLEEARQIALEAQAIELIEDHHPLSKTVPAAQHPYFATDLYPATILH